MSHLPPSYEFVLEEDEQPSKLERILRPIRQMVDPVARAWVSVSAKTEAVVSRVMHPLLAKRLVFLLAVVGAFIFLYFRDEAPGSTFLGGVAGAREIMLRKLSIERIEHTSHYFASMPHTAGTSATRATAKYVYDALVGYGLDRAEINSQEVFLTHLDEAWIEFGPMNARQQFTVREGTAMDDQPLPHMPLGVGGTATGPLLYVNQGTRDDLNWLRAQGLEVQGCIVIVRYGGGEPGMTARRLWDYGAAGVIFFSYKTPGVASWPEGPDYSVESVQRASLGVPQLWPGDISSPGWSSMQTLAVSLENAQNIVKIPVVALSWSQVEPLLKSLEGVGRAVPDWHNNGVPAVEWWTGGEGTSPGADTTLHVSVTQEQRHSLFNVLGRVTGIEQKQDAVLVGASLDSMCGGGVKLSGLSVLLEVARAFALLSYEHDWKPLRTIYFVVWDGSTQNYAGVTEWIESVAPRIQQSGLVYVDLDKGVSGPDLWVEGSPQVDVRRLAERLGLPLADDRAMPWEFGTHDAFSSYCGVPSVSLGMTGAVYPKDSCYDTLEWQQKFGDSTFEAHLKLAELVSDVVLEYSDAPVVPFNLTFFGEQTGRYVDDLQDFIAAQVGPRKSEEYSEQLGSIRSALDSIKQAGRRTDEWIAQWTYATAGAEGTQEPPTLAAQRLDWNDRLTAFSKKLLHRGGLYNRDWFKNVVFGPKYEALATDRLSGTFPGVRDLVWLDALASVQQGLQLIADCLKDAAQVVLDARW